jgi:hypothetical protein
MYTSSISLTAYLMLQALKDSPHRSKAKQSKPTKIVLHKSPEGTNPALISVKKTAQ